MALHNYIKGDASTSQAPGTDDAWTAQNTGPYIGIVKGNKDPAFMGRLNILIPALAKTYDVTEDNLITCDYLSPFYGAKSVSHNKPGSMTYDGTQHSYGFWGVPPDLDTKVLVIFAEGKMNQGFWIGCIQDPFTNHMVPGIASSTNTFNEDTNIPGTPLIKGQAVHRTTKTVENVLASEDLSTNKDSRWITKKEPADKEGITAGKDKMTLYGTLNVPAGEINRASPGFIPSHGDQTLPKAIHPFADILVKQGLSADDVRGNTSSSARRETPSQVFGISTPGKKNRAYGRKPVGTQESGATEVVDRLPGHTFTMDDGDVQGENQLIRLRTASGHQFLMHDTDGVVYIANGSGNAWIEMNKEGRIDVYSGVGGINLRTEGDFNLHSDSNINMHAKNSIRMSATESIISSTKVKMDLGSDAILAASQNGAIRSFGSKGISSYTEGQQLHGARGGTHLAGGQIHFNSTSPNAQWGPTWMNTGAVGITERDENDVDLTRKGIAPLEEFTRDTKTTVHRFVTHEPMARFSGFSSEGVVPSTDPNDDQMDTKMWAYLSNTPGTVEFMKQRNRISEYEPVRLGQYQADLEAHMKKMMGDSTAVLKAKKIAEDFAKKYDKTFQVIEQAQGAFETAKSISHRIKNFDVKNEINNIKDNIQTQLTNQVVERVSGKVNELFKDQIFTNKNGKLFTLGKTTMAAGPMKYLQDSAKGNLTISGINGNIALESIGSIVDGVSVKNVFKNVVSGQITSVAMKHGVSLAKSTLLKHGVSLGNVAGTPLLAASPWAAAFQASSVGKYLTNWTSTTAIGGWVGGAASAVVKFFSDARLKENIQFIGKSPLGTNIYSFKYKHTNGTYQGVMAQEVPWASELADNGYYMVDYNKLDVEFRRLN